MNCHIHQIRICLPFKFGLSLHQGMHSRVTSLSSQVFVQSRVENRYHLEYQDRGQVVIPSYAPLERPFP